MLGTGTGCFYTEGASEYLMQLRPKMLMKGRRTSEVKNISLLRGTVAAFALDGSSVGVELNTNNNYWSSTEYSSNNARNVNTNNGNVNNNNKNNNNYVRAWLRVGGRE